MREAFFALADRLTAGLRCGETLLLNLEGEDSEFVRLNRNRVRQAGSVSRRRLTLELVRGTRHATAVADLGGEPDTDLAMMRSFLDGLRDRLPFLPEDPFLNYATAGQADEQPAPPAALPDSAAALQAIITEAEGLDLVGIWASGDLAHGFASSLGRRLWHSTSSFHLDWSAYHAGDKAVKYSLAGSTWSPEALTATMRQVRSQLELVARPAITIRPGSYRTYLAPRAVRELLDMMAWGGFGLKSHRTRQTPLLKMVTEDRRLHPALTLAEDLRDGLTPQFTRQGFLRPDRVVLIDQGAYGECLADARSAKEYGQAVNAASEYPDALTLAPGDLPLDEVLERLGSGLYVGHLWYLNFSDRNDCRVTGMTRFACFWVQDGEIRGPVNVMRFDDSIYRLLGDGLLALTAQRELILDEGTYGGRSTRSYRLPGILVEGMRFTL